MVYHSLVCEVLFILNRWLRKFAMLVLFYYHGRKSIKLLRVIIITLVILRIVSIKDFVGSGYNTPLQVVTPEYFKSI